LTTTASRWNQNGRKFLRRVEDKALLARRSDGRLKENALNADLDPAAPADKLLSSRWGAFRNVAFTVIWVASTISNIGVWMASTGSGWLMTGLDANPMAVSLVQVAAALPMFLFTLPAGALADIVETRRFLIVVETVVAVLSFVFSAMVSMGLATPSALLATVFLVGVGRALCAPAWLAITPLLVPRIDLESAVAATSVGFNVSRAVGPALAGVIIGVMGIGAPFWVFGFSNLVILAALLWWRSPPKSPESLPAERLTSAIRTGIRHTANNRYLLSTLMRALAFFPFASAYWALLPLVARTQMIQGPENYGALLGAIGAGALASAFALTWLKSRLGPDRAVETGTLGTALALVLFGLTRDPAVALCASVIAGASWTIVLANLYVSAQVALPDWVRGRGLAIFLTVFFGAMAAGSAVWGRVATMEGLPTAFFAAASGAILAIPMTWRWKLQAAAAVDLTPSMHWRGPVLAQRVENDQGPVLLTIEYRVAAEHRAAFLVAIEEMGQERKRDGAFAWGVFEDAADHGRFLETFLIESWLELRHLRERVTNADRMLEDELRQLIVGPPQVTFLLASERGNRSRRARAQAPLEAFSTPQV
jgi:MFS family permease